MAMIHAARGDVAASRAADGGKYVDEQDHLKRTREQAADKAALANLLKQAESIS